MLSLGSHCTDPLVPVGVVKFFFYKHMDENGDIRKLILKDEMKKVLQEKLEAPLVHLTALQKGPDCIKDKGILFSRIHKILDEFLKSSNFSTAITQGFQGVIENVKKRFHNKILCNVC